MNKWRGLTKITASIALLCTTATGCSSNGRHAEKKVTLPPHLCETNIPTTPIGKIFPGPYNGVTQHYSRMNSLSSLRTGNESGICTVILRFKDRLDHEGPAHILVKAKTSNSESPKELTSGSQKFDTSTIENISTGKIVGISGPTGSAVAFPCAERTDHAKSVKVSVSFTPEMWNITDRQKKSIADTIGTFSIRIARDLNQTYLRCLDPADLSGPIHTEKLREHDQW